jgi:hypothetical protein
MGDREGLMLDSSKYAEHFPDEGKPSAAQEVKPASAAVAPSPALLAALYRLEREFSEILRAQQSEHTEPSD